MKRMYVFLVSAIFVLFLSACDPVPSMSWTGTGAVTIYVGDTTTTCGELTAVDSNGTDHTNVIETNRSNLNRNVPGEYRIEYMVQEKEVKNAGDNYVASCAYYVISAINGHQNQTIQYGEDFDPLEGVTARDLSNNDLTDEIEVVGTVDTTITGAQTITYQVETSDGGLKTATVTITVVSDFNPEIIGIEDKEIYVGDTFLTYEGVTASDFEDGDLTNSLMINGTVDTSTPGDYTVTYTVTDSDNNTTTETITVSVITNTDPVITGAQNVTLYEGSTLAEFTEAIYNNVTASDFEDGNLTNNLVIDIPTEMDALGDYTVTYTITDSDDNTTSISITLTVIEDNEPTISGFQDISIDQDESYDLVTGVTALDDKDGDITNQIQITDTVDNTTPGSYTVTYSVTDSFGNITEETITVTVNEVIPLYSGNVLSTSTVEPYKFDIEFDVDVLENIAIDNSAFTITVDGFAANITNVVIEANTVTFTVDQIISLNSMVSVDYTKTGTNNLTYGGVEVPEFTNQIIDTSEIGSGGSSYSGNIMSAAAFDENTIDITFDIDTFDNAVIDESAFVVMIDGVAATITNSFVNIDTITLVISESMTDMSFVEVSYAPTGTNDLTYGGVMIAGFSDEPVIPPMSGFPF